MEATSLMVQAMGIPAYASQARCVSSQIPNTVLKHRHGRANTPDGFEEFRVGRDDDQLMTWLTQIEPQ
jgi:hypothetical protein